MSVSIGFKSHPGKRREHNEDSYAALLRGDLEDRLDALALVADGMGGVQGGEVASRLAVEALTSSVRRSLQANGARPTPSRLLEEGIHAANALVWRRNQTESRSLERSMGTTCVAAILQGNRLTVANVGDSRAYLLRGGELNQITEDHSQIWLQVQLGHLTREEARTSRHRNMLTQAIGIQESVEPDLFAVDLEQGDTFLICSDGLSSEVPDSQIAQILASALTPQEACDALTEAALQAGGSDNITMGVLRYGAFTPIRLLSLPPALPDIEDDEETTDPDAAWRKSSAVKPPEPSPIPPAPVVAAPRSAPAPPPAPTGVSPWLAFFLALLMFGLGAAGMWQWQKRQAVPKPAPLPQIALPPPERTAKTLYYGAAERVGERALRANALTLNAAGLPVVAGTDGKIWQISAKGEWSALTGSLAPETTERTAESASSAEAPICIAYDRAGNRYQTHPATQSVFKFAPAGTRISDSIGKGSLIAPTALAVTPDGNLYLITKQRLVRIPAYETAQEAETQRAAQTKKRPPAPEPAPTTKRPAARRRG